MFFLGTYPLGLGSFKRRAIRFYHFTLNCTGNVRRMAILFQWDSRGVSLKMEFSGGTKSGILVSTIGDIDITWPRNAD